MKEAACRIQQIRAVGKIGFRDLSVSPGTGGGTGEAMALVCGGKSAGPNLVGVDRELAAGCGFFFSYQGGRKGGMD